MAIGAGAAHARAPRRLVDSPWVRGPLVYLPALALQMTVLADLRIGGAAADIMLGLAIAGGLVGAGERGIVAGFALGVMYDLMLNSPFGLSALSYTLAAWIAARLSDRMLRDVWWATMLVGAAASAAGVLLYALVGVLVGVSDVFTWDLATVVAVVAIVNGLLMPITLRVQRWVLVS